MRLDELFIKTSFVYDILASNLYLNVYTIALTVFVIFLELSKRKYFIGHLLPFSFEIDETSPSMSGCCGDDCTYEILSRRTKYGEASGHAHGGGHCGGCCH